MTELFMFIALIALLLILFMFLKICQDSKVVNGTDQAKLKTNIMHKFVLIILIGIVAIVLEGIAIGIKIYIN